MTTSATAATEQRVEKIVETVSGWRAIETGPHRFGGTEFTLGSREVGHVHSGGLVDVNFPKRMRDLLVEAGWTGEHHVIPASGWTTLYVRTDRDVERAIRLLRLSYLHQATTLRRALAGRRALTGVSVDAELERLGADARIVALFDDIRAVATPGERGGSRIDTPGV